MKVIKAKDVNETVATAPKQIDEKKVAELREQFDAMQQMLTTKEYAVLISKENTEFLFNEFYQNVSWKGYESYAISETYERLNAQIKKDGSLNGKVSVEIIEAVFHFLKNYMGSGFKFAKAFREVCDQFAIPMNEINQDRQNLRDLSLELVSVEQGIPVEQLIKNLQEQQGQQQY